MGTAVGGRGSWRGRGWSVVNSQRNLTSPRPLTPDPSPRAVATVHWGRLRQGPDRMGTAVGGRGSWRGRGWSVVNSQRNLTSPRPLTPDPSPRAVATVVSGL
ncbi:unnamed protein product [Arctogadus glacialis]